MRILKISDVYFPRINGVSTSIRTFRDAFLEQGHEVTLIAPRYDNEPEEDDLIRLPARPVPLDPEDRLFKRGALRKLEAELRSRNYDLIHIHTPFLAHYEGMRLAKRLDLPVVETYHTYFEEYLDKYIPFIPRRTLRYLARHFSRSQCAAINHLVVPSEQMLEVLRAYGIDTPSEVIPTGIDAEHFGRGDGERFRRQYNIPKDRPVLVHVGRMAHEKNIDFLLDVVAKVREQVPDILMLLAGEGPALKDLQKQVQRMNMQDAVMFVGYLDRNTELPDCFAAGDLFIFASRTETQGLVLLEAMACGTPVVSTAVLGTASIMQAGKGGVAVPESEEAFADTITALLDDDARRAALAEEARLYAADWSVQAMAERMLTLYQGLIDKQR